MKNKFPKDVRSALRNGWIEVKIPRTNLYKYFDNGLYFGDSRHFNELTDWCNQTFENDQWLATLIRSSGFKKFAFKNQKDATMFILKWYE